MSMGDQSGGDASGRRALVAEYVLGLLGPDEHRRMAEMIADDRTLQEEEHFWTSSFAALDAEFAEAPVPARLLARIEGRLFGQPEPARGWGSFWDSLAFWRAVAAGAAAIAVFAIGANLLRPELSAEALTTQLVAALEAEGSDVRFLAFYDGAGTLRLTALSGATAADQDLELWAIEDDSVISMGVVPIGEAIEVKVSPEILEHWGEGSSLALTLEPKGGSPTGVATGPIVAQGQVTRI
ncbi:MULTISPECIES: anti-sigma factor [unclassified Devosia]|uniref:anti-sigma factor n=1 Tax=unclassified Devosia TaxID=196773 RepID=UPI001551DA1F|nr:MULTISPECIES: anti-sigma factor [unclassified Devosia]